MTFNPYRPVTDTARAESRTMDLALRHYMLRVYNLMAGGLGLTGVVAVAAVASGFYQSIAGAARGGVFL